MSAKKPAKKNPLSDAGLVKRFFTSGSTQPEDTVQWTTRKARLTSGEGGNVFQQDAEVPHFWSDRAATITAKHYFRGTPGTESRETSYRQVLKRVVGTITKSGVKQGILTRKESKIFADELTSILLHQKAAFNSPVYYNVGCKDNPQTSACFIVSVNDQLVGGQSSIAGLVVKEASIFKGGSGSGTDLSRIREANAPMSKGGKASGVLSWMKIFDSNAGGIKSGGRTRRAACMRILSVEHPDIEAFIGLKTHEERKIEALVEAGFDGSLGGEAEQTVTGQNANNTVRVDSDFMEAAMREDEWTLNSRVPHLGGKDIKVSASEVFEKINTAVHQCGDPGLQFGDTINNMNTCRASGRINGSNPCLSEGSIVQTSKGLQKVEDLVGETVEIPNAFGEWVPAEFFYTGIKPTVKVILSTGQEFNGTADHRLLTDGEKSKKKINEQTSLDNDSFVQAGLSVGKTIKVTEVKFKEWYGNSGHKLTAEILGFAAGDGSPPREQPHAKHNAQIFFALDGSDDDVLVKAKILLGDLSKDSEKDYTFKSKALSSLWKTYGLPMEPTFQRDIPEFFFRGDPQTLGAYLRGLFSANGCVLKKYSRVQLRTSSKQLARSVQIALSMYGIISYFTTDKPKKVQFGNGEYECRESYNVCVSGRFLSAFQHHIGFIQEHKSIKLQGLVDLAEEKPTTMYNVPTVKSVTVGPEKKVYDFTEEQTHTGTVGGIAVHNCGEFMFLDDTACNLSSINLGVCGKNSFDMPDIETFRHIVSIMFIAQEILIDMSSYPTETMTKNSKEFRPLGLGFGNLGALLMANGIPYDSNAGRKLAASLASLLTAQAYLTSTELAKIKGPFAKFQKNKKSTISVLEAHQYNNRKLRTTEQWPDVPEAGSVVVPIPPNVRGLTETARKIWRQVVDNTKTTGIRNAQATLMAPTGTISFMMDFDTTGVEPCIALSATKDMVDGSQERMVFRPLAMAIKKVFPIQSDADIPSIAEDFIAAKNISDVVAMTPAQKGVFECAMGNNPLSPEGHVLMIAAIQPFISGAISKTVNLPREATVESISNIHILAWQTGVKAISVYRDQSKNLQPLSVDGQLGRKAKNPKWGGRMPLPSEVNGPRHKVTIAGTCKGFIHFGEQEGKLVEVFIQVAKSGGTLRGIIDAFGVSLSHCLQLGMSVEQISEQFMWTEFAPSGWTDNPQIPYCTSILDYVAKLLAVRYLGADFTRGQTPEKSIGKSAPPVLASGICPECSGLLQRSGSCLVCTLCGVTTGCS